MNKKNHCEYILQLTSLTNIRQEYDARKANKELIRQSIMEAIFMVEKNFLLRKFTLELLEIYDASGLVIRAQY